MVLRYVLSRHVGLYLICNYILRLRRQRVELLYGYMWKLSVLLSLVRAIVLGVPTIGAVIVNNLSVACHPVRSSVLIQRYPSNLTVTVDVDTVCVELVLELLVLVKVGLADLVGR